jgi:hypothetical protein
MPLSTPKGDALYVSHEEWLAQLVNERHERNWNKIDRFVEAVRTMPPVEENTEEGTRGGGPEDELGSSLTVPRSFDVVGDIALLQNMPPGDEMERRRIGEIIMKKNKAIKVSLDCDIIDAALCHAHPRSFRWILAMCCPHVESRRHREGSGDHRIGHSCRH